MPYIRFTEDASCMDPKAELPMKKPGREIERRRDQAGHYEQGEENRSTEHSTGQDKITER
jgi:hypothetical protein